MSVTPAMLLARGGFPAPSLDAFSFQPWFTLSIGGLHLVFDRILGMMLFGTLLIFVLFFVAFRKPKLVPRGLQNVLESVYDFVDQTIARDVIGPEGPRFTPYLLTMFCFVFVMNIYEVLPGAQFPVTSKIAFPAFLAAISWLVFNAVGIRRAGAWHYFKEIAFPPGVPLPMYVILTPIEIVSTLIVRPFTLAVRLFANMFAGHLLLLIFFLATQYLLQPNVQALFAVTSGVMSVVLVGFEVLVDSLQAYIITILTAVYISGALAAEH